MKRIVVTFERQKELAQEVAKKLNAQLVIARLIHFADSEMNVSLENASLFAGAEAIVLHSTYAPVSENVLATAFLMQCVKQAGAKQVIGAIPYFGFGRQESNGESMPGHAQLIAKLFENAGCHALISVQMHAQELVDLFNIPVKNMSAADIIAQHIKAHYDDPASLCIVAPDEGAHYFAQAIADAIGASATIFQKERYAPDQTRLVGASKSCDFERAIMVDDIIDTGGTALNACAQLIKSGVKQVDAYFVHPVLSHDAASRIQASAFGRVWVSNSIPLALDKQADKIEVFDIAPLIINGIEQL